MFNRITILGITIIYLASTKVVFAATTIRLVNLSTKPIVVEHGKLGYFCRWQAQRCSQFKLNPTEYHEFIVSSDSKYAVSATALPRPVVKNPAVRSYFSSELGRYAFYVSAYGSMLYLTKETGEGLIALKIAENRSFKSELDSIALNLADSKQSEARAKLMKLAANEGDPEFINLFKKIEILTHSSYAEIEKANLRKNGSELLITMATSEILRESMPAYQENWLERLAAEHPKLLLQVVSAAVTVLGQNAGMLMESIVASGHWVVTTGKGCVVTVGPMLANLILANPIVSGKIVLKGAGLGTYWSWNRFKTSTWTSIATTESNEDHTVEIQIKDYFDSNISMQTFDVSPENIAAARACKDI